MVTTPVTTRDAVEETDSISKNVEDTKQNNNEITVDYDNKGENVYDADENENNGLLSKSDKVNDEKVSDGLGSNNEEQNLGGFDDVDSSEANALENDSCGDLGDR